MNVELWSTLPLELVERTLSFLSVPVLCRLRTVCKRWNSLICKPEFGALCVRHAGQDARFVVLRDMHGYGFLDLSARRWYTIKQEEQRAFGIFKLGIIVAVDGGLVCRHLYAREGASVFVSNPLSRSSRRLPSCPATAASVMPRLTLVADNVTNTFKIFLMPNGEERRGVDPVMVIYESATNQWRHSTIAPTPPFGPRIHVESCIFLDGLLYVLMAPCTSSAQVDKYWLWSYNHVEDAWKDTCVNINVLSLQHPELIVSDNRLFLASWMQKCPGGERRSVDLDFDTWSQLGWAYEICEVHLAEKTLSTVFVMTEAVMTQLGSVCLKAIGCCKAIVLLCWASGISILYDLSTSLWDLLPANPSIHSHDCHKLFWYGSKSMSLTLPQWDLQPESEAQSV